MQAIEAETKTKLKLFASVTRIPAQTSWALDFAASASFYPERLDCSHDHEYQILLVRETWTHDISYSCGI